MIRVVTDSSCDLPQEVLDRNLLTVVPLNIRFGDDDFVDRVELPADAFWKRLQSSEELPETAAPPVGRFAAAFGDLQGQGAEGIVVVGISADLSGTLNSATLAAEAFDGGIPIRLVDSRLVSSALGLVALAAARVAQNGGSLEQVVAAAEHASARTGVFAALDTLEFLKRGGRIGAAQAFFGGLLNVKPLISIEEGVVAPADRVRTRKKALAAVLDHVMERVEDIAELAVLHSDPPDLDDFLAQLKPVMAKVAGAHQDVVVARLGSVVGAHAGPGLLGVCYRLR